MTQDDDDLVVVRRFLNAVGMSGVALIVRVADRNEAIRVLEMTATAVDPEPA